MDTKSTSIANNHMYWYNWYNHKYIVKQWKSNNLID